MLNSYWSNEIQLDFSVYFIYRWLVVNFGLRQLWFNVLTCHFTRNAFIAFCCVSRVIRGHQHGFATAVILLMAAFPLCRNIIIVVLRSFGIKIWSSKNTTTNLVDNCFWYGSYSSGICSNVLFSKHSSVFSNFSPLFVSVAMVFRSEVNCCSTCLILYSRSHLSSFWM